MRKALIIRFSSLGDIVQAQPCAAYLRSGGFDQIDWLVKKEFLDLLAYNPQINRVWTLDSKQGIRGLWQISGLIAAQNYQLIYDAHLNLRSRLLRFFIFSRNLVKLKNSPQWVLKNHDRWKKFLLFRLKINLFEQPFSATKEFLKPLNPILKFKTTELPKAPQIFYQLKTREKLRARLQEKGFSQFIALAPNAQHDLKKWPIEKWQNLISESKSLFVILGGPTDQEPILLAEKFPQKVWNWAGQTSLEESLALISLSDLLIANDTGVLHMADQMGHPCVVLIGPTAFGYPSNPQSKVVEISLPCKPCSAYGKNPCYIAEKKKCLNQISAQKVLSFLS